MFKSKIGWLLRIADQLEHESAQGSSVPSGKADKTKAPFWSRRPSSWEEGLDGEEPQEPEVNCKLRGETLKTWLVLTRQRVKAFENSPSEDCFPACESSMKN